MVALLPGAHRRDDGPGLLLAACCLRALSAGDGRLSLIFSSLSSVFFFCPSQHGWCLRISSFASLLRFLFLILVSSSRIFFFFSENEKSSGRQTGCMCLAPPFSGAFTTSRQLTARGGCRVPAAPPLFFLALDLDVSFSPSLGTRTFGDAVLFVPLVYVSRAFGAQKRFMEESCRRVDACNRAHFYLWVSNR